MLDAFVADFIKRLGHNYGSRQLQNAATAALGRRIAKREMLDSMRRINPYAFQARRDFADARRTRGSLDHIESEFEWWQTDLDCKLQDYGLYVGGTMDVATRFVYNVAVLTWYFRPRGGRGRVVADRPRLQAAGLWSVCGRHD